MVAKVEGDIQFAESENVRVPAMAKGLALGQASGYAMLRVEVKRRLGLPKSPRSVEVKSLRFEFSASKNIAVLFEDFDHRALARTRGGGLDHSA